MQQYKYTALDMQKKKFKGTFIAQNVEDLAAQLSKHGLFLVESKIYNGGTPSAFFTTGTGGIKLSELTTFCRQFSIMLNAGISVLGCIDILKGQSFSSYFKKILQVIYEDVKSGVMLSEALKKHKKVFPAFFRSMCNVGEVSGQLEQVFNSLASYYERDQAIKRKTKSAFAYPIMLLGMTVAIVILMLVFVIPTFRETLDELEVEITGLTKAVYDISDFLLNNWLYLLAGLILIIMLLILIGKTKKGAFFYDWLKIRIPFIKNVTIDLITSKFARGFGLLLSSGMDITEALDAVLIVFGNKDVESRFKKASEDVKHGMSLTLAFQIYKLFPEIMLQMIAVGEKTAALDEILNRSCAFFDDQVEASLNSVTSKIQPIMLIILGVIIGTLFLAIYSPMISIMNGMSV